MKAAVTFSPRDIRVESIPDPVPGAGEVLVKVDGCGICGGDYSGHKPGVKRSSKNLEATIGGHEVVGAVADCGEDISDLPIGSRVAVSPNRPCRRCLPCHNGMGHLCHNRKPRPLHQGAVLPNMQWFRRSSVIPFRKAPA
jgi:L-idonate 5-dehydrogenase